MDGRGAHRRRARSVNRSCAASIVSPDATMSSNKRTSRPSTSTVSTLVCSFSNPGNPTRSTAPRSGPTTTRSSAGTAARRSGNARSRSDGGSSTQSRAAKWGGNPVHPVDGVEARHRPEKSAGVAERPGEEGGALPAVGHVRERHAHRTAVVDRERESVPWRYASPRFGCGWPEWTTNTSPSGNRRRPTREWGARQRASRSRSRCSALGVTSVVTRGGSRPTSRSGRRGPL